MIYMINTETDFRTDFGEEEVKKSIHPDCSWFLKAFFNSNRSREVEGRLNRLDRHERGNILSRWSRHDFFWKRCDLAKISQLMIEFRLHSARPQLWICRNSSISHMNAWLPRVEYLYTRLESISISFSICCCGSWNSRILGTNCNGFAQLLILRDK